MEIEKFKTKLRYRGSRDGWKAADFHRISDGIGPTVSLFKVKENEQCVGGFTNAEWSSPENSIFLNDKAAKLFNLTKNLSFACQYKNKAI